jgi:light-regulated signal transduction histidine kinase (bacteriophytochrome)
MTDVAVRFGEADLTTCDREPIHIPGSIQPDGALLVVDRRTLAIEQAAGNTDELLGITIDEIVTFSVPDLVTSETETFIRSQLATPAALASPVIRLAVHSRHGSQPLDLTLHAVEGTAIIELEPARRTTTSAGDPIAQLKTLMAAIQSTASVDECCAAAATAMRAATGFDRAMVYRFLPDGSGVVAAEDATVGLSRFWDCTIPHRIFPSRPVSFIGATGCAQSPRSITSPRPWCRQ